jgi:phenylacetate-CoA ligase
MHDEPLTEAQRFPLLNDNSRAMLRRLKQHPHAPRWTYECGDRLDAAGLANVQEYARQQQTARRGWQFGEIPGRVREFFEQCRRDVPFYRARIADDNWPTFNRSDLQREPWSFVPDSADLTDMIAYRTSGTTGNLLQLPAHPVAPARYLPLFESALAAHGVSLEGGDRVSLMQVAAQFRTYTFASISSYLQGAGFTKINLATTEWTEPDDRLRFIEDCAPEIITSDPFALEQLANLPVEIRPKAILSSATLLLPALRQQLRQRFGCPVIDVYSMNETGPIAFARTDVERDEHQILPHNLFVEIMDEGGNLLPPGERGEIVVTGGVNPMLPLVRYRTGDFGAMHFDGDTPHLMSVERRKPVVFRAADGSQVVSIGVTVRLYHIPLPFFSLRQSRDGALLFRTRCDQATEGIIRAALREVFGDVPLEIEQVPWEEAWRGKSTQYACEIEAMA